MLPLSMIVGLLALALVGFRLWVSDVRGARRRQMMERVGSWTAGSDSELVDDLELPFLERVLAPWVRHTLVRLGQRLTPQAFHTELAEQLQAAGSQLGPEEYFLYRILGSGVALLVSSALALGLPTAPPLLRLLGVLMVTMVVFLFPGIHLKAQAQQRLALIERGLPEVFDLLSVSVEAGLAFDGALKKVADNVRGPAQAEFARVLSDMRLGLSRTEALKALADRTQSSQLRRFAALIAQSDRTGSGVGTALQVQARDIKEYRSTRAREKAASIPIKIIFPMVVFIFPAIFIVILGPAVLSMIKVFGHGGP